MNIDHIRIFEIVEKSQIYYDFKSLRLFLELFFQIFFFQLFSNRSNLDPYQSRFFISMLDLDLKFQTWDQISDFPI